MYSVNAQKKVSDKQHQKAVSESKLNGTAIESRDTLYCSGIAKGVVATIESNMLAGTSTQAIYKPGDTDVLVLIDLLNYNNFNGQKVYYTHYEFPRLQLECDIKLKDIETYNPYSALCQYDLINSYGLDTNKTFIFTTLKGKIPANELNGQRSHRDTVTMMRSIIAPRNTNAEIVITDENIFQDKVMFASFVADTLAGQFGPTRHFMIYNSKGVLICTATEKTLNNHDWKLLSYKDNRFHTVMTKSESDLKEILQYLIRNSYL